MVGENIPRNMMVLPESQPQIDSKIICPEGRSSLVPVLHRQFLYERDGKPKLVKDNSGNFVHEYKEEVIDQQMPIIELLTSDIITANLSEIDEANVQDLLFTARALHGIMLSTGIDLNDTIAFNRDLSLIIANKSKGRAGRVLDAMREHRVIQNATEKYHQFGVQEEEEQKPKRTFFGIPI